MKIRFAGILAAIVSFAVAVPTALAGHHEEKSKGHGKSVEKAEQKTHEARGRAAEQRGEAEERAEEARGRADTATDRAGKGRGDEMRARRDERKAIMKETKDAAEPGTPRKGKKPWYRFWESDEDDSAD